jgi:hypothetical protein
MGNWTTSNSQVLLFLTLYSLWKYVIFLHAKALRFSLVLQTLYVSLRILSYSSLSTDKPSTIIYSTKLNLFFSAICSGHDLTLIPYDQLALEISFGEISHNEQGRIIRFIGHP